LLSHGFSVVSLSHDLLDAMSGAQSIMTGGVRVSGAFVKTEPGLTRLRKWSRNASKLIPTAGFMLSTMVPVLISHLWSVKGWRASPTLVLPKAMPANVRGAVDMAEEGTPANPPERR
jgi:hypothetical protein